MDLSDCSPEFINHLEKYFVSNNVCYIGQERETKEGQSRNFIKEHEKYKHLISKITTLICIYKETLFEKYNLYHDALFRTSIPEFPYANVRTVISKTGNCHSCVIALIKENELHLFMRMYNNDHIKVT